MSFLPVNVCVCGGGVTSKNFKTSMVVFSVAKCFQHQGISCGNDDQDTDIKIWYWETMSLEYHGWVLHINAVFNSKTRSLNIAFSFKAAWFVPVSHHCSFFNNCHITLKSMFFCGDEVIKINCQNAPDCTKLSQISIIFRGRAPRNPLVVCASGARHVRIPLCITHFHFPRLAGL